VKLLCIGGFLGSGKTTLLLQVACAMVASSLKVAIVENEIGQVGVDGEFVRELGVPVQELFGGCICCTLQTGLLETLRDVDALYAPDWVIVEPTGMASPGDVAKTVRRWLPQLSVVRLLTVVDAERFEMLCEVVKPLIEAQVQAADAIVVNKIDAVSAETLEHVIAEARRMNESAALLPVSAEAGTNLDRLFEVML
jgi:G3E family GTPase